MGLIGIVKNLLNLQRKIDVKTLPSQGFFYQDDFEIWIKKADMEDIIEYEFNFIKEDLGIIINKVKTVVEKNLIFSYGYSFYDLRSIDIIFLFLEIVKFTKGDGIKLSYVNEVNGKEEEIEFGPQNFNYFDFTDYMKYYNSEEKRFEVAGYMYALPSIGVENCLTNFLISKSNDPNAHLYNNYFYDFTHFLEVGKNSITFDEIENLVQIFNYDIDPDELNKVKKVMEAFLPVQSYSLVKNGRIIEITSKIDLEKIWQ